MTKNDFSKLVDTISGIGSDWHGDTIVSNSLSNSRHIKNSIAELNYESESNKCVVVSAGPSLHHTGTLEYLAKSNFSGTIVAIDASYVKCLKAGIIPDFLLTLDPHPTRVVRWFGDPDFEKHAEGDDYFSRQDLDIDFRNDSIKNNLENIELVNKYAPQTKLIIASTTSESVVERVLKAGFPLFWWVPLVDDPNAKGSLTKKMSAATKLPAFNTGGNVGTAAWVFAKFWLEVEQVALIGMDLGYRKDLPYEMTQTYYELVELLGKKNVTCDYFPKMKNPLTNEEFYTDPTYYWYRKNLLDLVKNSGSTLYNCTEGGVLFGQGIRQMHLNNFINGSV